MVLKFLLGGFFIKSPSDLSTTVSLNVFCMYHQGNCHLGDLATDFLFDDFFNHFLHNDSSHASGSNLLIRLKVSGQTFPVYFENLTQNVFLRVSDNLLYGALNSLSKCYFLLRLSLVSRLPSKNWQSVVLTHAAC